MPRPASGTGRYMPGLDGLRALAVLAVIAYHLNLSFAPGGLLGVGVFFVLSGYLITDLLRVEWERGGGIRLGAFWARRARRLLPALFLMLLATLAFMTVFDRSGLPGIRGDVLAATFYYSNWWYIFHHVSYFQRFAPAPLTHLWSLAVEEQFYLLWPLLLSLGLRYVRRRGALVALILVLAAASAMVMALIYVPGSDPSRVYYGTDTRAFALLLGAALAIALPSARLATMQSSRAVWLLDGVGALGVLVIIGMVAGTSQYEAFLYRGGLVLLSFATAGAVAALAHPGTRLARLFSTNPLRWLGVRSYGIYLWHYPVIVLTSPPVNTGGINWLLASAQVAASIGLAAASWRIVEEPTRRGAIGRVWAQLQGQGWRIRRLPLRATAVAFTTVGLLGLSCVGLTGLLPEAAASTPEVASLGIPSAVPLLLQGGDSLNDGTTPSYRIEADRPVDAVSGTSGSASSTGTSAAVAPQSGAGITMIGDSVSLDAAPYLQAWLPGIVVDGMVGRQMVQAPQAISELKQQGLLGDRVIVELGTNGPFTEQNLISILKSLGKVQQIVLVNTRVPLPWESEVNSILAQVAAVYPHTTLVNWYAASQGKNAWFYSDGVHLNPMGAQAYARLLISALQEGAPTAKLARARAN